MVIGFAATLPLQALAGKVPAPAVMLANVYHAGISLEDYWVSEKYDGVRGFWDGRRLLTRGGTVVTAPAWFTAGWPSQPMDGELWAGHGRFETAASTVGRDVPDEAAWRAMRFMVFDLPQHPGPFSQRLDALKAVIDRIGQPWVHAVAQRKVASHALLMAWLVQTVRSGGEGLMLHRADSLYRGERNDDLLKLKPFDDAEATVTALLPGRGKYEGRMGALQVITPAGISFRLGSGFSDADRLHPPAIGSVVTFRHRGLHPSGIPRFASFLRLRTDAVTAPSTR